MQELLDIPDSQRTEEEWDELNELEIQLAPINREGGPEPRGQRTAGQGNRKPPRPAPQQSAANNPSANPAGGPAAPKRNTVRRFRKRPPKPTPVSS